MAPPISSHPDAPPSVIPRRLFVHSKKILTQKDVFLSVPVHVTHAPPEGGRVLRLPGQPHGLKSPSPIQKHRCLQPDCLPNFRCLKALSQNFLYPCPAIRCMGRIPSPHPGHPPSHAIQPPPRHNLSEPFIVIAFQYLHHPVAIPVPIIHPQWLPRASAFFVLAVPTPVACHQVQSPVSVKIPHSYTVP